MDTQQQTALRNQNIRAYFALCDHIKKDEIQIYHHEDDIWLVQTKYSSENVYLLMHQTSLSSIEYSKYSIEFIDNRFTIAKLNQHAAGENKKKEMPPLKWFVDNINQDVHVSMCTIFQKFVHWHQERKTTINTTPALNPSWESIRDKMHAYQFHENMSKYLYVYLLLANTVAIDNELNIAQELGLLPTLKEGVTLDTQRIEKYVQRISDIFHNFSINTKPQLDTHTLL